VIKPGTSPTEGRVARPGRRWGCRPGRLPPDQTAANSK